MRRGLTVGLAMVIAAVAPGCGGSGPSASDKQVAAITDTFNSYIAALQRGDGRTACSLLTPAYQRRAAKLITPIKKPQLKGASCAEAMSGVKAKHAATASNSEAERERFWSSIFERCIIISFFVLDTANLTASRAIRAFL